MEQSFKTEHRPYHHGDLRKVLIDAACDHIKGMGTEKLSLRALAREAGVSPTAPYRHFPTKNCLLAAIALQGFQEAKSELSEKLRSCDPNDFAAQIKACGQTYVNYAVREPVKFQIMFGDVLADFSEYEQLTQCTIDLMDMFLDIIKAAQKSGEVDDTVSFEEIAAYIWCAMHGAASLIALNLEQIRNEVPLKTTRVIAFMESNLDILLGRLIKGTRK